MPNAQVNQEPTYDTRSPGSYFRDLALVALDGMEAAAEARERLAQHSLDIAGNDEARELAQLEPETRHMLAHVPPLWLLRKIGDYLHRPYIDTIVRMPLPPGTDSINIPLVTGKQDFSEHPERCINAPVRATGGQQEITEELVRSSPIAFDEIVFRDLLAEYATQTSRLVISGPGQGVILGVRNTPGIGRFTADFSGDLGYVMTAVALGIKHVNDHRYLPPTNILMHPTCWEKLADYLGTENPALLDVPVVTDPQMPADAIHVARTPDIVMWEGGLRVRALRIDPRRENEKPTVLLQLYAHSAFSAGRYPSGIAEISASAGS